VSALVCSVISDEPTRTEWPSAVSALTRFTGCMDFGPIVSPEWLAEHLSDENQVIVDLRWSVTDGPGREAYDAGHIPGAVFADLDADLSGVSSDSAGRHPLPSPLAFGDSMTHPGIGDRTRVVVYDDAGGLIAARLWWMPDAVKREVAVLDGGIQAWTGKLSKVKPKETDASFTPRPWPSGVRVSPDEVAMAMEGDGVLIDGRLAERYADGSAMDPRPGHIPGAKSVPASGNLEDGNWKSPRALREIYEEADADGENVIAYCGSGVTACADLLGRRLAGLPDGRLYPGSWSQWGADEDRPAKKGAKP
jgi:thiosulfate/3-mercaptopyruvate sulfurtransferase